VKSDQQITQVDEIAGRHGLGKGLGIELRRVGQNRDHHQRTPRGGVEWWAMLGQYK